MSQLTGGCLCGQVRYHSDATPLLTGVCHCRDCQKQTGTSFSIIVALPDGALRYEGKMNEFVTIGASGQQVHRHFCGHCGSPIVSIAESMPGMVFLKAGTLDDPSTLSPQMEVWCDTAQPWLESRAGLPRMPGNPPSG